MAKYKDEIELLIKARNEAMGALRSAEAEQQQLAQRQKRSAMEQEQFAKERAGVEREIRDKTLRMSGNALEAELIQVRASYASRIAAARNANQIELAERLKHLQRLREAEVAAQAQQAKTRGGILPGGGVAGMLALGGFVLAARTMREISELSLEAQRAGLSAGEAIEHVGLETLKTLPAIGDLIKTGENLREMMTGERAELERMKKATEEHNKLLDKRAVTIRENARAMRESADIQKQLREELELLSAAEQERAGVQMRQEAFRRLESIQQRLAAQREKDESLPGNQPSGATRELERELEMQLAINRRIWMNHQRERHDQAQREYQERRKESADLLHEQQQLHRRMLGKNTEAEIIELNKTYDERIRLAEQAADYELAHRLESMKQARLREIELHQERKRELDELAAKRDKLNERESELMKRLSNARGRGSGSDAGLPTMDSNRYLTGVRQETEQSDRSRKTAEQKQLQALEKQIEELKQLKRELEQVNSNLSNAPLLAVGNI